VTPIPFENGGGLLPDLSKHNTELASNAAAIRKVATERQLVLVDLYRELSGGPRLTSDGLQLTPGAQGLVAARFATQLGFAGIAKKSGGLDDAGKWKNPAFEDVRQEIMSLRIIRMPLDPPLRDLERDVELPLASQRVAELQKHAT